MATKLTKEQLIELITSSVESTIKELGLDKVDIKNFKLPTQEENEEKFDKMSKEEKVKEFFKGILFRNDEVVKALGGAVGSEGGYLIPTEFKREIIMALSEVSVMRPLVRVMPVSRRTGNIPVVTGKPEFSKVDENTAYPETGATFGELTYSLFKLGALVPISEELVNDSAIDVVSLIKELFAEQYAEKEDYIITEGDGVAYPVIGFNKDTNIPSIALTSDLTYDDLVKAFYSLTKPYRRRSVIITSTLGVQVLRKVKDNNGNPILVPPTAGGDTFTLFGRPVIENPYMEDTLVDPDGIPDSGDEYFTANIVFGAFSKYAYLFDANEWTIKASSEGGDAFIKDQILVKTHNRIDFKLVMQDKAFIKLTGVK